MIIVGAVVYDGPLTPEGSFEFAAGHPPITAAFALPVVVIALFGDVESEGDGGAP